MNTLLNLEREGWDLTLKDDKDKKAVKIFLYNALVIGYIYLY